MYDEPLIPLLTFVQGTYEHETKKENGYEKGLTKDEESGLKERCKDNERNEAKNEKEKEITK
jgi:hypothetical protein